MGQDEQAPAALKPGDKCIFPECTDDAVTLAVGKRHYISDGENPGSPAGPYCRKHANQVTDEANPEYVHACPNCGCWSGVN